MNLQTSPMLRLSTLFGAFHWAEKAHELHFWTFDFFWKTKKRWNLKSWFLKTVHQRVSWAKIWAMCQNSCCREILNALRQELLKHVTTLPHYTTLQHYYITTLLHYCITALLHYYITLLHYHISTLLHYYITTVLC